jgi:hypothetical protein
MPVAQVIRIDERQMIARPRRKPQEPATCVILHFPRSLARSAGLPAVQTTADDDDQVAGRGRDPG